MKLAILLLCVVIFVLAFQVITYDAKLKNLTKIHYAELDKLHEPNILTWSDNHVLQLSFSFESFSLVFLKNRKLTWEEFKELPKSELVIEEFKGDARGVGILILSRRDESEILK